MQLFTCVNETAFYALVVESINLQYLWKFN